MKYPVIYALPEASTVMEVPPSLLVPPNDFAQTKLPNGSSFCTKTSEYPFEVRFVVPAPGSKSTVYWKNPVVYTFPDASTVMEVPPSLLVPPNDFAQTKLPNGSSFCTKTSEYPFEVRFVVPAPGSKSTVYWKNPVVYTFPDASTVMEVPPSKLHPPKDFAHSKV